MAHRVPAAWVSGGEGEQRCLPMRYRTIESGQRLLPGLARLGSFLDELEQFIHLKRLVEECFGAQCQAASLDDLVGVVREDHRAGCAEVVGVLLE